MHPTEYNSLSIYTVGDLLTLQCTIKKNCYEQQPQDDVEIGNPTILGDFSIHTDRKIDANNSHTAIKDYKNNSCLWTELMFPMDKNLSAK